MSRKELISTLIDEMMEFGESYIGTLEVQGRNVIRLYNAILKEVQKNDPKQVVCWDVRTGHIWLS